VTHWRETSKTKVKNTDNLHSHKCPQVREFWRLGPHTEGRNGVQWTETTLPVMNGRDWGILLSRRRLPEARRIV
jgi:hypothetical protein